MKQRERPELAAKRATERAKYQRLLEDRPTYGSSNHGRGAVSFLVAQSPESVLDVGCGGNQFARELRTVHGIRAVGVDFVNPAADHIMPAHDLDFPVGAFEWVTAFDVLEHLVPDEVDEVLGEMRTVARRFLVSIAHRPSAITVDGANLHPTVQPEDWWLRKMAPASVQKFGRYLWGEW